MNRAQWIAVAGLLATAGILVILFLRNPQPPMLPSDLSHVWRGTESCMTCHDNAGASPRSPNHPIGQDCKRCHGDAR